MPVPPLIGRGLRIALGRVLPRLLPAQRSDVEVVPNGSHRLVATIVDEVGAENPVAVADEHVVAVPLVHAEVCVEAVGDGVPRHFPAHPRLQPRYVSLRRSRGVYQGRVAGIQMGEMADLVGAQRAAPAGMVGPTEYPWFEEGAVDDQLAAVLEQVEQTHLSLRPLEL